MATAKPAPIPTHYLHHQHFREHSGHWRRTWRRLPAVANDLACVVFGDVLTDEPEAIAVGPTVVRAFPYLGWSASEE
jgi:hypothetical protein